MKYVKGFILFWYDFLVGDSIYLAFGGVVVLALGYALVETNLAPVAEMLLPLVAIGTIWVSLPMRSKR
jgi:hypothetical protein